MAEVAAILSEAIGTTIRYVDVPPEAARQAQPDAGMPPYLADGLAELFAERRAGKESVVSALTPALLGRPATRFAEFAQERQSVPGPGGLTGRSDPRTSSLVPRTTSYFDLKTLVRRDCRCRR